MRRPSGALDSASKHGPGWAKNGVDLLALRCNSVMTFHVKLSDVDTSERIFRNRFVQEAPYKKTGTAAHEFIAWCKRARVWRHGRNAELDAQRRASLYCTRPRDGGIRNSAMASLAFPGLGRLKSNSHQNHLREITCESSSFSRALG